MPRLCRGCHMILMIFNWWCVALHGSSGMRLDGSNVCPRRSRGGVWINLNPRVYELRAVRYMFLRYLLGCLARLAFVVILRFCVEVVSGLSYDFDDFQLVVRGATWI